MPQVDAEKWKRFLSQTIRPFCVAFKNSVRCLSKNGFKFFLTELTHLGFILGLEVFPIHLAQEMASNLLTFLRAAEARTQGHDPSSEWPNLPIV